MSKLMIYIPNTNGRVILTIWKMAKKLWEKRVIVKEPYNWFNF